MFRIALCSLLLAFGACQGVSEERFQDNQVLGALLQAKIKPEPLSQSYGQSGKVQPGTRMKVGVIVRNVGDQPNAPGTLFVRFAFPRPLEKEEGSIIYQSETVPIPAIEPGEQLAFKFSAPHQWPSLFDFVRNEWATREYQAVAAIGSKEQVLGTMPIAFSAYYYDGTSPELAVRVSTNATFAR